MTTQTPPLTLLYLEDSDADFALAIAALRNDGIAIKARRVETLDDFTHSLERHVFDAILADYHLAIRWPECQQFDTNLIGTYQWCPLARKS